MNNLEAFNINSQSIYYDQRNAISCSLNLLTFAYAMFKDTYIYKNREHIKLISANAKLGIDPKINDLLQFTTNHLIDNIKISICFENVLKSFFLSNKNLIHKLDKNIFPELYKQQNKRPVNITEVLNKKEWAINEKIVTDDVSLKKHIKGIQENTINFSILLNKKGYKDSHKFDNDVITILNNINKDRNKLHLNYSMSSVFDEKIYSNFNKLNKYLEKIYLPFHNDLSDFLNLNEHDRKPIITITKT